MNSDEIMMLVRNDVILNKFFLGVFACDNMPRIKSQGLQIFISNTSKSGTRGDHWVLFTYYGLWKCIFYDPFALEPSYYGPEFQKHINMYSHTLETSKTQHQDVRSDKCGFFAIYIAINLSRGMRLRKISRVFQRKNLLKNDDVLEKYFKRHLDARSLYHK